VDLGGNTEFTEPAPQDSSWYRTQSFGFGFLVRAAMWIAGGFLMALAIACLLAPMLLALLKFMRELAQVICAPLS